MRYNKVLTAIFSAAAVATAAPAALAEKWDMPMAYSATNFHSENGAEFARCVTDGSGGALEIVTHPSGSLFKGNEIKRAVQTGQAPIGERLLSAHQNENPIFGVDSVPFLATSFDAAAKLWDAARPAIEKLLEEQNLKYLYAVPWPPQGLYFDREINSVADMEGLKFRSYNNATARLAELTGMLPVQIEAAEISQAFATGVAQSMVSSGATGYDRKVWESLSHFYEVDSWLPHNTVFVNQDSWNGLDEATQQIVLDCADQAAERGRKLSIDYTQFTLDGLSENGMSVEPASDTLKRELQDIGKTMTAEWLENTGAEGKKIIDAFSAGN